MPSPASSGYWHCASRISNPSLLAYCLWGSASSCHPHRSHSNTLPTAYITPKTTPQADLGFLTCSTESQFCLKHQLITIGVADTFMLSNCRMCTTM
ncbi:hypothetical protein QQF64_005379 [Cirrhinus molitorella]|uniref:Uncharacterized protein n=1 Tax=Cirrhinus molitorella TaxID=172907 RepID=A0ABR3MC22_9TELE